VSDTDTVEQEPATTAALPRLGVMAANLRRLTDVMLADGYDDGFRRPTRAAFDAAWKLLVEAEESVSAAPPAAPAPVGDGGLLIQWQRADRQLFLAVPADPRESYVYLRGPEYRRTIRELTGNALSSPLDWLQEK
jgi:hypothetical protein